MNVKEVFNLADKQLKSVIDCLSAEQLELSLPDELNRGGKFANLGVLVNYNAFDEAWIPDTLAGRTIPEVGDKYDGDLESKDPVANFGRRYQEAKGAVEKLSDTNKTIHLSYGDYPAEEYLRHLIVWRGFQAYDLSKFLNMSTTLPPAMVQGMWDQLSPLMDDYRKMGVYGPKVEISDDASLQDKLLAASGRQP